MILYNWIPPWEVLFVKKKMAMVRGSIQDIKFKLHQEFLPIPLNISEVSAIAILTVRDTILLQLISKRFIKEISISIQTINFTLLQDILKVSLEPMAFMQPLTIENLTN